VNLTGVPCIVVNHNALAYPFSFNFLRGRSFYLRDLSKEMLALTVSAFHFVLLRV